MSVESDRFYYSSQHFFILCLVVGLTTAVVVLFRAAEPDRKLPVLLLGRKLRFKLVLEADCILLSCRFSVDALNSFLLFSVVTVFVEFFIKDIKKINMYLFE